MSTDPDVKTINKVEAWFERELPNEVKDATWELNMSGIFILCGFGTEALHRGRAASKQEPQNWRANFAIANAYALEGPDHDLHLAIEEMSSVAATFKSNPALEISNPGTFCDEILEPLGTWKTDLKQYQSAMETYEEILARFPERSQTVLDILQLFKVQDKISEINDFLYRLNTQVGKDGSSRLVSLYNKFSYEEYIMFYDFLSATLQDPQCMALVRDTLKTAIDVARSAQETTIALMELRFWYAYLLYHIVDCDSDHDDALAIWEENLDFQAVEPAMRSHRILTAQHIAEAYLHRAKIVGFETQTARNLLARLEALPKYLDKDDILLLSINRLVARGYSLMGDEKTARKYLRGEVQTALELLSDDDVSNDWQGYRALALALTPLSDDKNALAAWSLMCPTTEFKDDASSSASTSSINENEATAGASPQEEENHVKESIQTDNDTSLNTAAIAPNISPPEKHKYSSHNDTDGPMGNYCDGFCGRSWSFPDDMYFCKDCRDVQLDSSCYSKLKSGTLKFRKAHCHSSHEFLYVPVWDVEGLGKVDEGFVRVGREVVTVREWLDGVKREWGFEKMIL